MEISDYGVEDAEKYFDYLWDNQSIEITENDVQKTQLLEVLENETLIKSITPFEAYVLVLKTYLESVERKSINEELISLFKENGYTPYQYQLDAITQALAIIEKHNGVILADVIGLGKTIMACAIAWCLRKRGVIICPPALKGDPRKKRCWMEYV